MKGRKLVFFLAVLVGAAWLGGLLADAHALRRELLRLHVVANSDSQSDQAVKLRVRDAVLESLEAGLEQVTDPQQAISYVREQIPKLTARCNQVLAQAGLEETVQISLEEEAFPLRQYDTFCLPSGVYQALRVVIGRGEGHNWWCVVFPALCAGATREAFAQMAQLQGMEPGLVSSLTGEYELRFWLLDQLGKLENFFHRDSE